MRRVTITFLMGMLLIATSFTSTANAARKKTVVKTPLTETGEKLEKQYSKILKSLKIKIQSTLPNVDEKSKISYQKAIISEAASRKKMSKTLSSITHLNWARSMYERAKKTNNKRELNYFKKKIDSISPEEPQYKKAHKLTETAYLKSKAQVEKIAKHYSLTKIIQSSTLDSDLAKYVIMMEATPYGLADYAQKGKYQESILTKFFSNKDLMIQVAVADGAKNNKYGKAMEIYSAIQKASSKANTGILQKLALAVSLEHAVPITQRNAKAATNAAITVNPVKRYLHYEKAYLDGELDRQFKNLNTWDLRMVVNGGEPDEVITWGRETLRNFRPDHVYQASDGWRYVGIVASDVKYGSGDNKYDRPELHFSRTF
jgi:hypothetical protein